jgi:hypothetical protein
MHSSECGSMGKHRNYSGKGFIGFRVYRVEDKAGGLSQSGPAWT